MRRFESAVKYLPESMENAREIELQRCKDDIKRLVQYSELKLQDSSITEKIDKINNCSFEYQNLQVIISYFNKEDFDGKMTRLSEKLGTYSIEQAKNYKIAFETFDILSLVDILKPMYICNSLLTQIKVYHDQHINKSSIVNTIKLNLEKLTPYPDMLESICQKIENLGKELINTKLFESNRNYHVSKIGMRSIEV
ncbi:unnamed protein product [Rotaria magnacalcarata]|uniref:Uncharacterized protein n=1 Tax=Rotaria magnacalcarata TaxID=392030 RepID=A0A8S3HCZ9_9BILA|nr:unnamed protein product [Rotaria magnacalcarata]